VPEPEDDLEKGPDDVALGVQFNTCIDAFSRHNGGAELNAFLLPFL
jgi:hypothetical protein